MKVFFDTNVLLDVLTGREPFAEDSARCLRLCEQGVHQAFASSLSLVNIFYILRKAIGREKALECLRQIRVVCRIIPVDDDVIAHSLESSFRDFEDAVQSYCALSYAMSYIITRDISDYGFSAVPAISPHDFLDIYLHQ